LLRRWRHVLLGWYGSLHRKLLFLGSFLLRRLFLRGCFILGLVLWALLLLRRNRLFFWGFPAWQGEKPPR
jgi:hypothetical protein